MAAKPGESIFGAVELAPPDAILGLNTAYKADTSKDKLNLGVGAYRTEEGAPWVLPVVKKVEKSMADAPLHKEYLPISGLPEFTKSAAALMLGENSPAIIQGRNATVQSISGTGALRLGAEFIKKFLPGRDVLLSNPTWGNHQAVFRSAGIATTMYTYYDPKTRGLDFEGFMASVKAATPGSIFVLHACAHNPTGVDPTPAQWNEMAKVFADIGHIAFWDSAYQGFASGDPDADTYGVRKFVEVGIHVMIAQSFAKNMGLYGERIGAFTIVAHSANEAAAVMSQLKLIIRPMYSSPPVHGARIVATILNDPELRKEWYGHITSMSLRIKDMRAKLRAALEQKGAPGTWNHITDQIGMFSFTGLTPAQVAMMTSKYHIYMLTNGRISMAGLSTKRINYMADAMIDCLKNA